MKPIFLQYSTDFLVPHNPILDYYKTAYERVDGFYVNEDTMEIPTWIPRVASLFDNYKVRFVRYDFDNFVVASLLHAGEYVLASVTDVSLPKILDLIKYAGNYTTPPKGKLLLGGYIDPALLPDEDWILWFDNPAQLYEAGLADKPDTGGSDYSWFTDLKTIPRLALSTGCWYKCHFCTIDRQVLELSEETIFQNVRAFEPLDFELIYIDDKTFGQARNNGLLAQIYEVIRGYNDNFRGFIVQTTVPVLISNGKRWLKDLHVLYAEVGIEYPDADFLSAMEKPYTLEMLDKLVTLYRTEGDKFPKLIPNIIFGLPAPYNNTEPYKWLEENRDIYEWINPFVLSLYEDQKGDVGVEKVADTDANETSFNKSWVDNPLELERFVEDTLFTVLQEV